MKKNIAVAYSIREHGITGSQYFTGDSATHTEYETCFVGNGDNPAEALESALEDAATSGWNVDIIDDKLSDKPSVSDDIDEAKDSKREEALAAWIEEQEQAGKIHCDDTPDDVESYDPDTFEWDGEDDEWDGDYSDSYYYVAVLVRGPKKGNHYEESLARRIARLDYLRFTVHNLSIQVKHPGKNRKRLKQRLHRLRKEQKKLLRV